MASLVDWPVPVAFDGDDHHDVHDEDVPVSWLWRSDAAPAASRCGAGANRLDELLACAANVVEDRAGVGDGSGSAEEGA